MMLSTAGSALAMAISATHRVYRGGFQSHVLLSSPQAFLLLWEWSLVKLRYNWADLCRLIAFVGARGEHPEGGCSCSVMTP